jgi:hypothetical protein
VISVIFLKVPLTMNKNGTSSMILVRPGSLGVQPLLPLTQKGQVLIEACFVLMVLPMVIAMVLAVTYLNYAKTWIQAETHELAVCQSFETSSVCENRIRSRIQKLLPIGRIALLRAHSIGSHHFAKTIFQIGSFKIKENIFVRVL